MEVLQEANILLNTTLENQEDAIRKAGQILVDNGYVNTTYVDKMIEREALTSTYMGNFVAIPHGTEEAKDEVLASGISIIQAPQGVTFDGNEVKLVFGIAGKNNEHLDILSQIAIVCSEEENIDKLVHATSKQEIIDMFSEVDV
ncbi:PTS system, mannitol-specific IIA component [Terribacillus halophilus]|uniref:Mannitol-specific phosphotransferase enzyme IIA component n=1 Tax=Terribacillus halophilus TaxID=361279 RepID=A0A1G6HWA3_9BACI|nr:PTS sugar transporter subunit IIA [Terribacillus halophilus]SDB98484.1 PTS system, mannitol-specific IIA component [Terribacillus halophilus]